MKTLVAKLNSIENGQFANGTNFAGSLGNYKSAEIEIWSPVNRDSGCFKIKFTSGNNVLLTLSGVSFKINTIQSFDGLSEHTDYSCIGGQDYYVYINGAFHTIMTISDITLLDTFDASINTGENVMPYEGVDIESKDLMKFSMVRDLGLRYSVRHPEMFNEENFIYFEKLQRLFIGSPSDTDAFESIVLPDGVMNSLTAVNWAVKVLPANFNQLQACTEVYLLNGASWINLRETSFSSNTKCNHITIYYTDLDDQNIVEAFVNEYKDTSFPVNNFIIETI